MRLWLRRRPQAPREPIGEVLSFEETDGGLQVTVRLGADLPPDVIEALKAYGAFSVAELDVRPRTIDDRFGIAQDLLLHGNAWVTTATPERVVMPPEGIVDAFRRHEELERETFAGQVHELGRQLRAVPPWSWCERLVAWLERRLERRAR